MEMTVKSFNIKKLIQNKIISDDINNRQNLDNI